MRKTHLNNINKMQEEHKTICEYCGKEKEGLSFYIGASSKKDWCMIEGTGKMCCPDCYDRAMAEGQAAIEKHLAWVNNKNESNLLA